MKLQDFEGIITNQILDKSSYYRIKIEHDFYFIDIERNGITATFDLLSGKLTSISCKDPYNGKCENQIGIGMPIHRALEIDESLGYNLDTDFFDRTPFDGLIIYPPTNLRDACIESAVKSREMPNFSISGIQLVNLDYAKAHWNGGEVYFE